MDNRLTDALAAGDFVTVEVMLKIKSVKPVSADVLVFRFAGQVYAYVNHCMHGHKTLNCQKDTIFDATRRWLRCSMHGFLFEPTTGVCISPVCEGQTLQSIKVAEENGKIVFKEKQLRIVAIHPGRHRHD